MGMMKRMAALALTVVLASSGAVAEQVYVAYGHLGIVEPANTKAFTDFGSPTDTHTTGGITFNLFYEDVRTSSGVGFDGGSGAAAQARIKDVLDELGASLNASGTLDVYFAASQTDGSGFLATAGTFFSVSPSSFQDGSSLRRINSGSKPFAGTPEITTTIDFGFNYNFTSAATSGGQTDFFSVMLHEFTHGLGFFSVTAPDGSSQAGSDIRMTYDSFLVKAQGGTNLWNGSGAFVGAASDLISNDVFFEGTNATTAYNQSGTQAGIFAPDALDAGDLWFGNDLDGTSDGFIQGSSISHFDSFNIVGGAVMEHVIVSGTDRRQYSAVDVGVLVDIGWTNAAVPG